MSANWCKMVREIMQLRAREDKCRMKDLTPPAVMTGPSHLKLSTSPPVAEKLYLPTPPPLFRMTSCSVYKLGELAGGPWSLHGHGLGIVHWVVTNCICASSVLYIYCYHCYYDYLFLWLPVKLSLSQPQSFNFFPFSPSSHRAGGQ